MQIHYKKAMCYKLRNMSKYRKSAKPNNTVSYQINLNNTQYYATLIHDIILKATQGSDKCS